MAKPQSFVKNDPRINRKGAPKREWTVRGLIEEAMEEENETGVPYKKLVYRKLVRMASKGDTVAIKELNNRLDGMPQQKMDLTTEGKPLINVDYEHRRIDQSTAETDGGTS